MGNILSEFIELLTSGITKLGTGIGSGVNNFVQDLFLEMSETGDVVGLSTFGGVSAIFAGVGLAVGLTTLVFNWIRSLGN